MSSEYEYDSGPYPYTITSGSTLRCKDTGRIVAVFADEKDLLGIEQLEADYNALQDSYNILAEDYDALASLISDMPADPREV